MNELLNSFDHDRNLDAMLMDCDDTYMPMPFTEDAPHLLISKVRKHYLDYIIKLLAVNYEKNQNLLGKNIYLPSAIWRCAKYIELFAAQSCMVAELYRRNILKVVAELKSDTKNGKLNRKLLDCLQKPPDNEKKIQTSTEYTCQCECNGKSQKKRKINTSKNSFEHKTVPVKVVDKGNSSMSYDQQLYKIPVITNSQCELDTDLNFDSFQPKEKHDTLITANNLQDNINNPVQANKVAPETRISIESEEGAEDTVMLRLEQLFKADTNEAEIDLFEGTMCDDFDAIFETKTKPTQQPKTEAQPTIVTAVVDEQAAKIKSLDERLALIESSGILCTNTSAQDVKTESPKRKKPVHSKWLCEAYFQKQYLFEKLDEIRDLNRKKYLRIQNKFLDLFGEQDMEEDQILSPIDETPEFILSCKERIAPWLVKILTPYYVRGRITGKSVFKSVAKHLMRLIYQCRKYPSEYEVYSFVTDFLKSHKIIRCEADFKDFRIENFA